MSRNNSQHISAQRPFSSSTNQRTSTNTTNNSAQFSSNMRQQRAQTATNVISAFASMAGSVMGMSGRGGRALSGSIQKTAISGNTAQGGDNTIDVEQMIEGSSETGLQYLAMQQMIQDENRYFSAMSNAMKAKHDTARAAISNIRV